MPKIFNFYVPAEYNFKQYFLPKINHLDLEYFEVDSHRHGIQRKGNNHLVVFLDYCLKKAPSHFTETNNDGVGSFFLEKTDEAKLFKKMFEDQGEVAVFTLSYNARMSVVAWKLLVDIANDERVLVRDDHGRLVTGPQCVQEHKELLGQA